MRVDRLALFVLGFVCCFLVFGLPSLISTDSSPEEKDKDKFQIIDKYKNCDVVRYNVSNLATYKYFLHCSTPQ